MSNNVKLKHLHLVTEENLDFPRIMKEVYGYQNTFLDRRLMFKFKFKKIWNEIQALRAIDISTWDNLSNVGIKYPQNVDNVAFQARIEVDLVNKNGATIDEIIITTLAALCFESNFNKKYDSDSDDFKLFKLEISNKPLLDAIGLYNFLDKGIKKSNEAWQKQFRMVEVFDKDWDEVNGSQLMQRFGDLNTVKRMIKDFNTDYESALKFPYSLVKFNQLEDSTRSYIQDKLTEIRKRRFKMNQKTPQ